MLSVLCIVVCIWASLVAQTIKRLPAVRETRVQSLGQEDLLEKGMAAYSSILASRTSHPKKELKEILGFPGGSEVKASACNAGDMGSIPGSGRSPGEGNGNPLGYSCLENFHGLRSLVGYCP